MAGLLSPPALRSVSVYWLNTHQVQGIEEDDPLSESLSMATDGQSEGGARYHQQFRMSQLKGRPVRKAQSHRKGAFRKLVLNVSRIHAA
jgi:hypothetical protein